MDKIDVISTKLKDERSKSVVFVSHCLLNENSRYFGGAFCPGVVKDLVDLIHKKNHGIIQMECPEQKAWGGITKPLLWRVIGSKKTTLYRFRRIIFPLFILNTKRIYRKYANEVIKQIRNYIQSGYVISSIIGIDGSPTCGVNLSLDMKKYELLASLDLDNLNREIFNNLLYSKMIVSTRGLFIHELENALRKKNYNIKLISFDLITESKNVNQILDI